MDLILYRFNILNNKGPLFSVKIDVLRDFQICHFVWK